MSLRIKLKHFIDATIDCVFKAILSAPGNENLLVDFLNSILLPASLITHVEVINPYNERDFIGDKLSIVDIKATDASGVKYQVEVQLTTPSYLKDRILYTWGGVYQTQIGEGDGYHKLKPVISIWLVTGGSFRKGPVSHHHFQLWDLRHKELLTDHCSIHVLDLSKWKKPETLQEEDIWLYFFKEVKNWKELPDIIDTPEMRQAMSTLARFSEQEQAYHIYKSRQDALRVERTNELMVEEETARRKEEQRLKELAEARVQVEAAKAQREAARAQREAARAEKAEAEQARLQELLRKAGINPQK